MEEWSHRQDDDPLVHFVVSMPSRLLPRVLDSLSLSLSLSFAFCCRDPLGVSTGAESLFHEGSLDIDVY